MTEKIFRPEQARVIADAFEKHGVEYLFIGKGGGDPARLPSTFIIVLGDGFYPINVLNAVKMVPEVCRIFCATANPTEVILAETEQGRGVVGVVDAFSPKGIEGDEDIAWRKGLLRQIGYKLG